MVRPPCLMGLCNRNIVKCLGIILMICIYWYNLDNMYILYMYYVSEKMNQKRKRKTKMINQKRKR